MPESFGRYELRELLGRGGMGEVYRALDTVRDREVALKLLPPHLASDESFQSRFRRESRLAARLNDPHIIPIHDFGEIDGRLFLDMRLVKGEDLSAVLERRGRLPSDFAVGILAQIASALDAAHDNGLVHRDVKPSNILLSGLPDATDPRAAEANPFAYLVDFGIARSDAQEGTRLTSTTATLGTVAYLAPERIGGHQGDRRVDVYALACVLFECLAGRKPFDGEMFAIMYGHVNTPPPSLRAEVPGIPAGLDAVVRRGMAKDPDDRYATAGDLARDAQAALRSASVPLPPQPVAPRPTVRHATPLPDDYATQRGSTLPPVPPMPPVRRPTTPEPAPTYGPAPSHLTPSHPTPSHPARGSRRRGIIAAVVALLVVAGGVGTVVALSGDDTATTADPTSTSTKGTTGSPTPDFPSDSGGVAAPLTIGTGSTAAWSDFASFSRLLGKSDGDTQHAFLRASCTLKQGQSDASAGVIGKVDCRFPSSTAQLQVARLDSAGRVQFYTSGFLESSDYSAAPWGQRGAARGIRYSSPSDAGTLNIATTICAMPTYLVQFTSDDPSDLPLSQLLGDYWNKSTFPDVVPPACSGTLRSSSSTTTSTGVTPSKPTVAFTTSTLASFLRKGDRAIGVTTAAVGSGRESIVFDQKGNVSFWATSSTNGLTRVGVSTYPVNAELGAPGVTVPEGQVFTGMRHATFVLRGLFTMDGSGNAIAYTTGSKGWGAIKAKSNGNLEPSGSGISSNLLGLGQDFGYSKGRLETIDCSTELPLSDCGGNDRVFKYWKWSGDEFVLVARAGLRR